MSDEAKIETRWSSTTEGRTAAAIYATGDPTGEGIPWVKADDSTRYVYVARARSALAALADAGLLALSAPSEPVPDGPRVWAESLGIDTGGTDGQG